MRSEHIVPCPCLHPFSLYLFAYSFNNKMEAFTALKAVLSFTTMLALFIDLADEDNVHPYM
jgi:hypothetical protein